MSDVPDVRRWVPPTWTWDQACELFEMPRAELAEWIDRENARAVAAGRLEPIIVSDDGTQVTFVGSPVPAAEEYR